MSNEVRTESRLDRVRVEVVSGGTQSAEPPPQANRTTMILGIGGWLALFGIFAVVSPWILVFIIGLALSIMLHEFGHYWTARRSGMKATQFFLGFGPRVWSFHRGETEYGLRAIPLGGFVKIIGMTNIDEVPEAEESRTYRQGSYARRMWVITAGSVMHLIIAFGLVTLVYAVWGQPGESGAVTLASVVDESPAAAAGLQVDDVVVSVDGEPVSTADGFRGFLSSTLPGDSRTLVIERGGEQLTVVATLIQHPDVADAVTGYLGVSPRSQARNRLGVGTALVEGPRDLFVGVGQAITGVAKVLNPVNVFGHLTGTNDDITSKPGTIVGAAKISDDIGRFDGWAGALSLLAALNISVGVFNMFPLMPLDGGHAAIATYERIRSRRGKRYYADVNKLMPVAALCIALLAFMFLTGLYLDIAKS